MLPSDPLNLSNWFNLDQSTWSMVVKPTAQAQDNSPFAIVNARFKEFHEVAKTIMEDGQLTPTFRRWLDGDPPPWSGGVVRHGCLVIDIEDKSGFSTGTSFGGNFFTGLIHALTLFGDDGYDDGTEILPDPAWPDEYYEPGWKGTLPVAPGIIFREGEHTGIQTSLFMGTPAKDVQHVTGGHSMPGVNEAISAFINMTGDLIAAMIGIPPIGGTTDAILKPLYCVNGDTIIDGPDGKEKIAVLAERGEPFRVWSITPDGKRVAATALFAYKKGETELFEYTLADGTTLTATKHHRWLTRKGWISAGETPVGEGVAKVDMTAPPDEFEQDYMADDLPDSAWADMPDAPALTYSPVVSVRSVGVQPFYDMHVPVLVNYVGNGIVSHNTDVFLAFMAVKDIGRAQSLGWSHYRERFASGSDRAYTFKALIALRASLWATRETFTHKFTVTDGMPWLIGQQGKGHFYLGDRIGTAGLKGAPKGKIYVDRVSEIKLSWDRKSSPTWTITVGQRKLVDPVVKALERIQALFGAMRDLGVL